MRSTGRVATLVAALALACGSRCDCNPNPSALAQSDLPLGAACLATSECAMGLECRFYDPNRNGECYKRCAGDPTDCPAGSSCDPVHGRCETSCLGDWYCSPETIALKCQGWNAQEGCWASHCSCGYVICNGDGECPKGSRCVEGEDFGDLAYGVDCIPGFCQLRP